MYFKVQSSFCPGSFFVKFYHCMVNILDIYIKLTGISFQMKLCNLISIYIIPYFFRPTMLILFWCSAQWTRSLRLVTHRSLTVFSWDGQEKCVILVLIIIWWCLLHWNYKSYCWTDRNLFFFLNEDSVNDFTRAFLNPNLIDTKVNVMFQYIWLIDWLILGKQKDDERIIKTDEKVKDWS